MSIYYIQTAAGEIYELDATANITYRLTGKATDNPVESGDSVSDNYVNKPRRITLRGSISDVKSLSSGGINSKDTETFITGLEAVKVNKELFTFHFGSKVGVITDCVFETLEFTQNAQRGSLDNIASFGVVMTIKQIRLSTRALLTPFRDPTIVDDASDQTTGAGATQSATGDEKSLLETSVTNIGGG